MMFARALPAGSPAPSKVSRPAAGKRLGPFIATGSALAAALAVGLALPPSTYVAGAIVGVEDAPSGLRPAMIQAAVDAAALRSVMARAAASLASPADRVGTAAGSPAAIDGRRLAEHVARAVRVTPGDVAGTLVVRATDADAVQAATLATSMATALVAELNERGLPSSTDSDKDAAHLEMLEAAATAAHRRLSALGGESAASASPGAAAAARVDLLRTRLEAVRAILASGSPPLGMGKDVPPAIDALQTSYLDLTRRLATARETLGERHTTVVGLKSGIDRTAAALTAAWTRLARMAEADLGAARARSARLGQGNPADDAGRSAAIDAARAAALAADAAVTQAQAAPWGHAPARYRLVARANVPAYADGLAAPFRLAVAAAAGLLVLAIGMLLFASRARPEHEVAEFTPAGADEPALPSGPIEPRFFDDEPPVDDALEAPVAARGAGWLDDRSAGPELLPAIEPKPAQRNLRATEPLSDARLDTRPEPEDAPASSWVPQPGLVAAMAAAMPAIARLVPQRGLPVVLVASTEPGAATMAAAMALGEAAAAQGQRVLVVEEPKACPALAATVAADAEPALVEVFGALRVVFPAEIGVGLLYVAPSFRNGARIAADLARTGDTLVADSLAEEFDVVIIDGDRAVEPIPAASHADAVLRVGRFVSPRDDERFIATLAISRARFLGTVAGSVFVPPRLEEPAPVVSPPRSPAVRPVLGQPVAAEQRSARVFDRRRMGVR